MFSDKVMVIKMVDGSRFRGQVSETVDQKFLQVVYEGRFVAFINKDQISYITEEL